MRKYARYKDSGISWIGKIPENWEVDKLGHRFIQRKEKVSDKDYPPLSVSKMGVTPQLESACKTDDGDNRKLVLKGDFVVNSRSDRKGSCGLSELDGSVSLINIVATPRNIDGHYIHYLFRSNNYIEEFYRMGRGIVADLWTTRWSEMRTIMIPVPPLSEQKEIVAYIEKKVSSIDSQIASIEKQIVNLNEYKQSLISDVVTGKTDEKTGSRPTDERRENRKWKESGVSWIGKIPENWEVKRIRHVFNESDEKITDNTGELLSLSQYTGVSLKRDCEKVGMFEAETTEGYKIVHRNQFVMNIMLAWNGSYAVSELEGVISPAYCVFNFIIDCVPKYFHYLLRLKAYAGAFKTLSKGIIDSRLRLYPSKFYTFPVIIPPLSEQKEIVAYIEKKVSSIDSQIASIENQIANLNEYKQSLISDVVTGKVKVC